MSLSGKIVNMNVVFMGTPDFAVPTLQMLYDKGYNVQAVFTQPDKPKGRGMKLTPPPVKSLALTYGTDVFQPVSLRKEADLYIPKLKALAPDFIVVVAFGQILTREVLDIAKYGCVNVHGSLLPKLRGAGPIQWSIINGDKQAGVTTMLMGDGIDTGDMLLKKAVEIGENETASELYDRLSVLGAELLAETLPRLANGEITPEKQDESLATYAPKLSKELCPIDFSQTVEEVHHKICGLSDWPCATTVLDGKRLKVYRSEILSKEAHSHKVGAIKGNDFTVACADGFIRLTEVQAEGGKRMSSADYLRGKPIKDGTILG